MKKAIALFLCLFSLCKISSGQVTEPIFDNGGVRGNAPMFPGCEELENINQRKTCAGEKMIQFIYSNLKYPTEAKQKSIEGTVVVKFFVEEDGRIWDAEVKKDIGGGCGAEALRVVESMPDWIPATIDGNPIGMSITLPIKFSMNKRKK